MSAITSSERKKSSPKGLGKGINILIPNITEVSSDESILALNINEIEPNREQPRRNFDDGALAELADSISEHGVIQPIIVRKADGYYEIVAGERRWRASRLAGLTEVPVIVRECGEKDSFEVALIENLQRENLSATEEALAYKRLADDFNLTQDAIAERVGKKRSTVANAIRILNLPREVLDLLDQSKITSGHAKAILSIDDAGAQVEIASKIAQNDLSVRQAEEMIKSMTKSQAIEKEARSEKSSYMPFYKDIERTLSTILGTRVRLLPGKNKSKMEIDFFSDNDLDRLIELFKKLED